LAIPVLLAGPDQLEVVSDQIDERAWQLAQQFWPGPLTLVVSAAAHLSRRLTGGGDTVAVRMPDHAVPLAIARRLGGPITGTSANRSGQPNLLTLQQVKDQLGGPGDYSVDNLVDYIVHSGPAPRGVASTVVDLTGDTPRLLREGALAYSKVLTALGLDA